MRGFAIHGERFQFAVRGDQQGAAGSFVRAARLHADEAIFDDVGAADPVLRSHFVQRIQQLDCARFRAVHGDRETGFKADFDFRGFIRRFFRGDDPLPHGFVGGIGGIFELAAFVAEVPDVAVAAVDIFFALLHRDIVFLRVGDGVFAGIDVPLAPRRDDLQIGGNGFVGEFETHLVVAFAGAAVGKAVSAEFQRDFGLTLAEDGAGHGGAEQISVLVDGAGAQRRPNVVADEFFAQVFDASGGGAGGERFFSRGFEVFLLADVADHGDDFALIIFFQPGNTDGGIEPAGVGEDDFFWLTELIVHFPSFV